MEALIIERLARLPQRLQIVLKTASVEGEIFTAEIIAEALGIGEDELIRLLSEEIAKEHGLLVSRASSGAQQASDPINSASTTSSSRNTCTPPQIRQRAPTGTKEIGARSRACSRRRSLKTPFRYPGISKWPGRPEKRVVYLNIAGEKAKAFSSPGSLDAFQPGPGTAGHFSPHHTEKAALELSLQINLAVYFLALKGYADANVGKALNRAYEISKHTEDVRLLFPIIWQLACYRSSQADYAGGAAMMLNLIDLAEQDGNPLLLALGHWGKGWSELWAGNYLSSQRHLVCTINTYDPAKYQNLATVYSQDPFATSRSILGLDLLALGHPEQGLKMVQSAVDLARRDRPSAHARLNPGLCWHIQWSGRQFFTGLETRRGAG